MPFPRKLLTPGEDVVVEAHPNWSVLGRPVIETMLVIAACIAVVVFWGSAPIAIAYVLAAIAALAGLWFAGKVIAWRSRLLVITTTRVIYRWGIVRRTGREIPLDRVQDVTYHQSLFERLVGGGSLTIESAGATGQEPFPDVRHPAQLQSLINQLITGDRSTWRRPPAAPASAPFGEYESSPRPTTQLPPVAPIATGAASGTQTYPMGAGASGALAESLRDLERLHEAGVLTDAEFDRKRKELLGLL